MSRPEPTAVPHSVSTTCVAEGVSLDAYPGHVSRAAQVIVEDGRPVPLIEGWPEEVEPLLRL